VGVATAIAGDEQDTEDVPSETVELAGRIAQAMAPGDFVTLLEDEEQLLAAASAVEPYADPEFETVMVGPEYLPDGAIYEGLEGYVLEFHLDRDRALKVAGLAE
jgi:hypothetical protein